MVGVPVDGEAVGTIVLGAIVVGEALGACEGDELGDCEGDEVGSEVGQAVPRLVPEVLYDDTKLPTLTGSPHKSSLLVIKLHSTTTWTHTLSDGHENLKWRERVSTGCWALTSYTSSSAARAPWAASY